MDGLARNIGPVGPNWNTMNESPGVLVYPQPVGGSHLIADVAEHDVAGVFDESEEQFRMSTLDRKFLRSLKIAVDVDED